MANMFDGILGNLGNFGNVEELAARVGVTPDQFQNLAQSLQAQVFRQYGFERGRRRYEIDHLIPLSLGGADEAANLWPESLVKQPWNAHAKNRLEVRLHELVCTGRLPLAQAQKEIAADWIAAYETYIGALDDVHGPR